MHEYNIGQSVLTYPLVYQPVQRQRCYNLQTSANYQYKIHGKYQTHYGLTSVDPTP